MRSSHLIKILLLLPLLLSCSAQSGDTSGLPDIFKNSIPVEMKGKLKLIEVNNRCDECKPYRYIDYYSNESKEPIKQEKVSVKAGYRAMYAYPNTEYFSNTKIEQSVTGEYDHDKKVVIDAITHEYNRRKQRVASYIKENPGLKEKMEPHRAKGKDYITFEQETINGYEYVSYTENVIGLLGNTISEVSIFVPEREIIITAYLLRQEKSKFQEIEEFLKLKRDFIESYTKFLKTPNQSLNQTGANSTPPG